MILGLTFLGMSRFDQMYVPPSKTAYNRFRFFGGGRFDKVRLLSTELTNAQIAAILPTDSFTWTPDTLMYAEFNGNLFAGNITGIVNPITSWRVYRRDPGATQLQFMAEIPASQTSFTDWRALQSNDYIYYIFAKNATEISQPLVTETVTSDYWGWFLIDPENNTAYNFDWNFGGGDLTDNESVAQVQTNTGYDAFSRGNRKFFSGTIQALVKNDANCTFEQTNAQLASLREFIHSDRTKYLKDRRGRMWKIFTSGYRETPLNNAIPDQPMMCEFNFAEVGPVFD